MRKDHSDDRDDQEDRNFTSGQHRDVPKSLEDAERLLKDAKENRGALSNIELKTDDEGTSRLLGLKIPKNVAPIASALIANFIPMIGKRGGEYAYYKGRSIAGTWKSAKGKEELIAVAAENIVRWGVIAALPIANFITATNLHVAKRKALFEEFSPVMTATKANYKTNEVIRLAFDELHDDVMTNIKLIAGDLPTMVPQALVGFQDQKEFKAKRDKLNKYGKLKGQNKTQKLIELENNIQDRIEKEKALRETFGYDKKNKQYRYEEYIQDELDNYQEQVREGGQSSKDPNSIQQNDKWLVLTGSLASEVVKNSIEEAAAKRRRKHSAWKMIKRLKREITEQCGSESNSACNDMFNSRTADDITIEDKSLKDYIIDIFQQHERDRMHIGETTKGDAPRPLGPALIERMMPSIDLVAEYVADGRLDPYALVNLVGENKLVIHHKDGSRTFAKPNEVQKTLDELLAVLSSRETVKPAEFFADFADPALIQDTLKKNLANMKGMEKAFFISLFPDDILMQAGMKKRDIVEHRKAAHGKMYDIVAAAVLDIAKKDPAHLKKLGLSEQEISTVSEVAQAIGDGDTKALQRAVDGRDKTIANVVRKAGLHEQVSNMDDGKNYWRKRIGESKKVHQEMEKAAAERNADSFSDLPPDEPVSKPFAADKKPKPFTKHAERDDLPVGPQVG